MGPLRGEQARHKDSRAEDTVTNQKVGGLPAGGDVVFCVMRNKQEFDKQMGQPLERPRSVEWCCIGAPVSDPVPLESEVQKPLALYTDGEGRQVLASSRTRSASAPGGGCRVLWAEEVDPALSRVQ